MVRDPLAVVAVVREPRISTGHPRPHRCRILRADFAGFGSLDGTPHFVGRIRPGQHFRIQIATPKRGDIVAFRHDDGARAVYIKRVIGLPGDHISIDGGVVAIGGTALAEPYVRFPDRRSFATVTVPPGEVYVLGETGPAAKIRDSWPGARRSADRTRLGRHLAARRHGHSLKAVMAQLERPIQWYPGHMVTAMRRMTEYLKLIDIVIEVVDARVPRSGRNPDLGKMIGSRDACDRTQS